MSHPPQSGVPARLPAEICRQTTRRNARLPAQRAGMAASIAIVIALLAGCVMPDGTVYTMSPEMMAALTSGATPAAVIAEAAPVALEAEAPAEASAAAAAYMAQGEQYLAQGDYAAALAEFEKAVAADANEPGAYFDRGLAHANLGDFDAAAADLERALELAPGGADTLSVLGQVYALRAATRSDSGDITGAVADVQEALRLNPWNLNLYGELQRLSQSAAVYEEKAAEYARYAAEGDSPGSAAYAAGMQHLLRAQLLNMSDEYSAAVEALTVAIEADPELAAAYHARGVARIVAASFPQGGNARYSSEGDEVTYTDPETGESVTTSQEEYAAIVAAGEEAAQAAREAGIADLERAVELDPGLVEAIYDLGVAYFAQQTQPMLGFVYVEPDEKGRDQALELFDRTVQAAPDWEQARLSRALASLHWGMTDGTQVSGVNPPQVEDLAYAPDGTSLAVARGDGSVDVWDAVSGELRVSFAAHQGSDGLLDHVNNTVTYSPDGTRLVTTGDDGMVRVWDAATGEALMALSANGPNLADALFSPDGSRIASVNEPSSDEDETKVQVWDAETGELLLELAGGTPIAFSPDGIRLISGESEAELAVWDVLTGEKLAVLSTAADSTDGDLAVRKYRPESIAFSPDGKRVAATNPSGPLFVWDIDGSNAVRVLSEGDNRFDPDRSVAFSPDGASVIIVDDAGRLSVWDVASGEETAVFGEGEALPIYRPDGTQIAARGEYASGTVNLHDAESGDLLMTLERGLSADAAAQLEPAVALLQTALADAEFLIERGTTDGWPYYVRALTNTFLAQWGVKEANEAQSEADYNTFRRLSPNVSYDSIYSQAPAQVRFSSPVPLASPLMAGRIEDEDGERVLFHDAAGFRLQIPAQGPNAKIVEVYVPGGPAYITLNDDFRSFLVLAMEAELGEMSAAEWLSAQLAQFGVEAIKAVDVVETELGEATIFTLPDSDLTQAVLPVGDRIFYFSYAPVTMEDGSTLEAFADSYGVQMEPAQEVLAEFVSGLSLLDE